MSKLTIRDACLAAMREIGHPTVSGHIAHAANAAGLAATTDQVAQALKDLRRDGRVVTRFHGLFELGPEPVAPTQPEAPAVPAGPVDAPPEAPRLAPGDPRGLPLARQCLEMMLEIGAPTTAKQIHIEAPSLGFKFESARAVSILLAQLAQRGSVVRVSKGVYRLPQHATDEGLTDIDNAVIEMVRASAFAVSARTVEFMLQQLGRPAIPARQIAVSLRRMAQRGLVARHGSAFGKVVHF